MNIILKYLGKSSYYYEVKKNLKVDRILISTDTKN